MSTGSRVGGRDLRKILWGYGCPSEEGSGGGGRLSIYELGRYETEE